MTEGLDGLRERLSEYRELGARFAKWRATYSIGDGLPTDFAVLANGHGMARYAALCQEAGIVPIVEPEILMDGDHDIAACEAATGRALQTLYEQMDAHRIDLAGTLLKVNMVVPGKGAARRTRRRDRRRDAPNASRPRPGDRAGDRVPVRGDDGRGSDQPAQRLQHLGEEGTSSPLRTAHPRVTSTPDLAETDPAEHSAHVAIDSRIDPERRPVPFDRRAGSRPRRAAPSTSLHPAEDAVEGERRSLA